MDYDIHGILKVRNNVDFIYIPSCFEVEKCDPDLTINAGEKLEVDLSVANRFGPHYYGIENGGWVYYDYPMNKNLLLNILDKAEIRTTGSSLRIAKFKWNLYALSYQIMLLKLLQKDHMFLHAACVSNNGSAILLPALNNTGKTATALNLLKDHHFISDDRVILNANGIAYSYPFPITLKPHTPKLTGIKIGKLDTILLHLGHLLYKIPIVDINFAPPFMGIKDIHEVVKDVKIDKSAKVETICLLERGTGGVEEVDKDLMVKKLLSLNRHEFPYQTHQSLLAYMYFNPSFDIDELAAKEKEILSNIVEKASCFVLKCNDGGYYKLVENVKKYN